MLKYVKKYTLLALLAAAFMVGEVSMDLIQPTLMSRIVDEGVLGAGSGGAGNMEIILRLGLQMIALVIFGGLCGSMNNVFTQTASQGIGNDIRKDCFRRIMAFSFPQMDRFGTGSLVTRVTNDITQVQTFLSLFVRGMIRTGMLTFGSIAFMLRLNPAFGRIVIAAFPLIVAVLAFCLLRSNPMFERLQAQLDGINAIMQEDVSGIRVIKACVRESYEKARFGKANDALTGTQMSVLTLFAFMNPTVNMLDAHRCGADPAGRLAAGAGGRDDAGHYHGVDHLYHPAAQRHPDAGDALSEHLPRRGLVEARARDAFKRAGAFKRRAHRAPARAHRASGCLLCLPRKRTAGA